jgi:exodeoxyribonuclease VII large subunit
VKPVSLFELNEYLRRVVALNFPESLWIRAEIAQLNDRRGTMYIELIEKDKENDTILAQTSAILWQNTFRLLLQKHGKLLQNIFQEGVEVLLKANVTFHERYGMSLTIEDIDLSFTLGKFALIRQQTLDYLKQKKLLDLQKNLNLPLVLQRIAIISSEKAAGFVDFQEHIKENQYGYQIDLQLFESTLQGQFAAEEITKQLVRIKAFHSTKPYDAVVIIRGGGSKIDLLAFDDKTLNEAVSKFPIPVLAGIGHEIDETVLDFVAYKSLKTPTAVADFIVQQNARFETQLLYFLQDCKNITRVFLETNKNKINYEVQQLEMLKKMRFLQEKQKLDIFQNDLKRSVRFSLKNTNQQLLFFQNIAEQNDPKRILKKGFSITKSKNKIVTAANMLQKGDEIETIFADGTVKSNIYE